MPETRHYDPGSDGGACHWAIAMTLIQTAKLNDVNPMAYLTDVLERIVSGQTKRNELHTLLPWNCVDRHGILTP
jgi:transposase